MSVREIAHHLRTEYTAEVAHLTDEALLHAVREARHAAFELGISSEALRLRFIMLGVISLPHFWLDPTVNALLRAPTGTADIRFGDVCALFKVSATDAGKAEQVWWS